MQNHFNLLKSELRYYNPFQNGSVPNVAVGQPIMDYYSNAVISGLLIRPKFTTFLSDVVGLSLLLLRTPRNSNIFCNASAKNENCIYVNLQYLPTQLIGYHSNEQRPLGTATR